MVPEKCKLDELTKAKLTKYMIPNIIFVNLSRTNITYFKIQNACNMTKSCMHNAYLCIFLEVTNFAICQKIYPLYFSSASQEELVSHKETS